ncbi:MAG: hypothetical protein IJ582_05810 [Prevotella sp.]|nr:hypothetical protein [Prevotella sp.]
MKTCSKLILALMAAVFIIAGCAVEDDDNGYDPVADYTTCNNSGSHIYRGVWSVDGVLADSCVVEIRGAGQVEFNPMPWQALLRQTEMRENVGSKTSPVKLVGAASASFAYMPTGYSANVSYYNMEAQDFDFECTLQGITHQMHVKISGMPVLVADYQKGTVTAKFTVKDIYDGEQSIMASGKEPISITFQANMK